MTRRDGSVDINEASPLIGAQVDQDEDTIDARLSDGDFHLEDSVIEYKSTWYLMLLTLSIGGLQIVWSVELSNGSPYLLSLGMSKALVAFVWVAGPVTGVLVQPYIGIKSDRCRVSWGKRKPFMLAGTLGTVVGSLLLAYAKELMSIFGGLGADAKYEGAWKTMTIIWATVMMWALDFCINTVQAAIRAFICDGAPAHQQEAANAWASRMTGIGNVIGYLFGYLDLPQYFSYFGNTQFKVLVAIASIALSSTMLISVLTIRERNPQLDPPSKADTESFGVLAFFKQVFVSITRLPLPIRKVCEIQFFHWMGWFPFLFYITTYIGQLYVDPYLTPGLSEDEVDDLWAKATRIGTLALLIYAITSFGSNIILPFLVVPTYKPNTSIEHEEPLARSITPTSPIGSRNRTAYFGDMTHSSNQGNLSSYQPSGVRGDTDVTSPGPIKRLLGRLQVPGLTLRRTWLLAQLLFSTCMFSTFFISTPGAASVMTALVGISWSLTIWAPFALISGEIAERDEARRRRQRQKLISATEDDPEANEEEDKAGIILGLHNVAVSAPQVLATMVCSAIFKSLQKQRSEPGDVSIAWCMRFGGLVTLVAVFITWRMEEPGEQNDKDYTRV
jgi:solute carrier family 45, member 1/2/4